MRYLNDFRGASDSNSGIEREQCRPPPTPRPTYPEQQSDTPESSPNPSRYCEHLLVSGRQMHLRAFTPFSTTWSIWRTHPAQFRYPSPRVAQKNALLTPAPISGLPRPKESRPAPPESPRRPDSSHLFGTRATQVVGAAGISAWRSSRPKCPEPKDTRRLEPSSRTEGASGCHLVYCAGVTLERRWTCRQIPLRTLSRVPTIAPA